MRQLGSRALFHDSHPSLATATSLFSSIRDRSIQLSSRLGPQLSIQLGPEPTQEPFLDSYR